LRAVHHHTNHQKTNENKKKNKKKFPNNVFGFARGLTPLLLAGLLSGVVRVVGRVIMLAGLSKPLACLQQNFLLDNPDNNPADNNPDNNKKEKFPSFSFIQFFGFCRRQKSLARPQQTFFSTTTTKKKIFPTNKLSLDKKTFPPTNFLLDNKKKNVPDKLSSRPTKKSFPPTNFLSTKNLSHQQTSSR